MLLLLMLVLHLNPVYGQQNLSREEYISTFSELAMREMARVGIRPASPWRRAFLNPIMETADWPERATIISGSSVTIGRGKDLP
jgi:hypothetical protein